MSELMVKGMENNQAKCKHKINNVTDENKYSRFNSDKLFKNMMEKSKIACEFFNLCLPQEIIKKVDLQSIQVQPRELLGKELQSRVVDMLYSVKLNKSKINKLDLDDGSELDCEDENQVKNKSSKNKLYILVEHQSGSDKMLAFRLHEYRVGILVRHIKLKRSKSKSLAKSLTKSPCNILPLPWVEVVVCYAGKNKMPNPLHLGSLFGDMQSVADKYFPQPVNVFDICRLTDEQIGEMPYLGVMAYLFKYRFEKDFLKSMTRVLSHLHKHSIIGPVGESMVELATYYLYDEQDGSSENLYELLEQLPNYNYKEKVMTFRESFIEEGRVEGQAQGRVEGQAQGRVEGRVEGREEGVLIGQQTVANSLINHGMTIDYVSNITGIKKELLELWAKQKD